MELLDTPAYSETTHENARPLISSAASPLNILEHALEDHVFKKNDPEVKLLLQACELDKRLQASRTIQSESTTDLLRTVEVSSVDILILF